MKYLFIGILTMGVFFYPSKPALAGDSLVAEIPLTKASFMTVDPSGNCYVVTEKNNLIRFNKEGHKTGDYDNVQNGKLTWVDATNPLKILLFYPQFSKIVLLDKMMSPKATIKLQNLGFFNATACGMSQDNHIWLYDNRQARLFKINGEGDIILKSNDLRTETRTVPEPAGLIDEKGTVYLPDLRQGIYTFDRYGTYLNTLEITNVRQLQVINHQLLWVSEDTLHNYNLKLFSEKDTPLPKDTINALISRHRLYILFPDKVDIFVLP